MLTHEQLITFTQEVIQFYVERKEYDTLQEKIRRRFQCISESITREINFSEEEVYNYLLTGSKNPALNFTLLDWRKYHDTDNCRKSQDFRSKRNFKTG